MFVVAALVATAAVGVYRAGLGESPRPPVAPAIVFLQGIAHGQRITTRSWSASYDRAVSNADQTVLDVDGVRDGLIFKAGKPYLRVRAAHMSVNTISRDFSIAGPLHVETIAAKPNRTFDTTSAIWNDSAQRLTLAERVVVRTQGEAPLSIGSLTFDVKTGNIELRQVAGPIRFR